ncbi:RAD51-associated protein 1 isoform X2 [Tiliqua scincoides]|uniref:RAD51-associated protein 1 isoform X2 n=1 Tax=Tiliqua scincoides TaxID=71010 RepID=UPI003462C8A7
MAARPARRCRKAVDYSQSGGTDDDDEDFASVSVPSNKKLKSVHSELKKEKKKVPKEEIVLKKRSPNERVNLDDKLYQRHLEVALALSVNEPSLSNWKEQGSQEQALDGSTNECDRAVGDFRQGAAAAELKLQTKDTNGDGTDSYEPATASLEESESDSSFSEDDCDEFVVKKKIKQNRKEGGKLNAETKKRTTKPSKRKTNVKSQSALPKASCSSDPIGKPLKTSSPLAVKKPTWIPPAASGNRANQQERVPAMSPTQGLRLGLSRLARVKPLHPSFAST